MNRMWITTVDARLKQDDDNVDKIDALNLGGGWQPVVYNSSHAVCMIMFCANTGRWYSQHAHKMMRVTAPTADCHYTVLLDVRPHMSVGPYHSGTVLSIVSSASPLEYSLRRRQPSTLTPFERHKWEDATEIVINHLDASYSTLPLGNIVANDWLFVPWTLTIRSEPLPFFLFWYCVTVMLWVVDTTCLGRYQNRAC